MTFIEAATHVLQKEGRPLHAKEIAEKAIALGLLSHVGKTPVQTMSARISAAVAKGRDEGPFVRVSPGVFGLVDWKGNPPQPERLEALNRPPSSSSVVKSDLPIRPQPAMPPVKVDTPIRSQPVVVSEPQGNGDAIPGKKRKRRRRKASHGQAPAVEAGPRPQLEAAPRAQAEAATRLPQAEAVPRPQTEAIPSPRTAPTARPPGVPPQRPQMEKIESTPNNLSPEPFRVAPAVIAARAEDLTERVEAILRKSQRPLSADQVYEQADIKGEGSSLLIDAILAADGFDRISQGLRPRFVKHKNGYGLLEREISSEIVALEKQAFEVRRRLLQISERQVQRKLRSLTMGGFIRVMIIYLHRAGFGAVAPVDLGRPGEFHLSVQDRRHQGRFRTAVVLRRDSAEFILSERTVMDLRGAMHHYDAMGGLILTTGQVSDGAVAEGRVANLPPVALIDGETIAREMVRLGIGVKERPVPLPAFDEPFFNTIES